MTAKNPSIQAFMRPELKENPIVEIPGIDTFKDENGVPIPFKIRMITTSDLERIRKGCKVRRIAKDTKGKPIFNGGVVQYSEEYDGNAMGKHMIEEAMVFPDLHDKELLAYYEVNTAVELIDKLFRKLDDFTYVLNKIQEISGISDDGDEIIEEAKN